MHIFTINNVVSVEHRLFGFFFNQYAVVLMLRIILEASIIIKKTIICLKIGVWIRHVDLQIIMFGPCMFEAIGPSTQVHPLQVDHL